jgi:hypothetical protein
MPPKKHVPEMVTIIRDPQDMRKDYVIPLTRAYELYKEGKLLFDQTNGRYCTPKPDSPKVE